MKIRNGFVSNSSSSSFIISVHKTNECSHCKRSDSNFLDFIKKIEDPNGCDRTKMYARGAEEVIKWVKHDTGYIYNNPEDNKEFDEVFKKIIKSEKIGFDVGAFSIGYHDEIANNEFRQQQHRGAVTKIWSDH
jgi:hypothetical protein